MLCVSTWCFSPAHRKKEYLPKFVSMQGHVGSLPSGAVQKNGGKPAIHWIILT